MTATRVLWTRIAFAFAVAVLAGCGSGTPTTAPTLGPVSQNLTLSGTISGTLTTSPTATCAVNNHAQLTMPLTISISGPVSGTTVDVTLRIDSYIGPGNYEAQQLDKLITGASVTKHPATAADATAQLASSTGEISVGKNGSGTVDMTMGKQTIKGTWHCR